jgi:hypothetical protein
MVSFKSLLVATSAALAAMAMPKFANNTLSRRQTISGSGTGNVNGYYYSLWTQANGGATMNVDTGSYSLNWQSSSQNVVGGLGWNPGSSQFVFMLLQPFALIDLTVSMTLERSHTVAPSTVLRTRIAIYQSTAGLQAL